MKWLYLLSVKIIEALLPIAILFTKNKKLNAFVEGRKLIIKPFVSVQSRVWFHCASLGEFEQARPLIELLKSEKKDISIVVSFFSPSGYEQKKDYPLADLVFYLPLDTPKNAKNIIEIIKPTIVIFVKYEIWYFHLKQLFKRKVPVYLISATFRQNQYIFSVWGRWLFNLLPQYKTIFLQDKKSFDLLKNKGLNNIVLAGDTRFDRVFENAKNANANAKIEAFKSDSFLLVLGSSWAQEEDILLEILHVLSQLNFKVLIAPHDISENHIAEIEKKFKSYGISRYTQNEQSNCKLLILNTIGHLASAYCYANLAFIGGGFTGALHNILEPLAFGVPVVCGSKLEKFPESKLAKDKGVLFTIENKNDFRILFENIVFQFENKNRLLNRLSADFIAENAGATQKVYAAIYK